MKVFTIEQDPSTEEIAQVLRQEFSSGYSYRFFGIDQNRSIVVRKSEFVGAQISKNGNQVTVHAMSPNWLLSFLDPFLTGMNVIGTVFHAPLTKLEADLVTFLKSKYA
ncbi:hypothetical protein [Dyadobacter sediminis]|uniref:Uncharacterized protein n=1 Tax=Dyadobacter sediminis TaxID=1493691 RepID=A0A5R9KBL4_9BACT|nr:hypothetical protein [Dyadobacter sediminis]TLU92211.1 hypothetical protein FEM55_15840 [Dyadobacter sediminis]GGB96499.1 hypothetical protein GCM10011325_24780 [Dyadobacter sediminis]